MMEEKDEKLWSALSHLGTLIGYVIPFGNIITPLVIWQVHKDKSTMVSENAKEALNFQILVSIIGVVGFILSFILIGIPVLILLAIVSLVFSIIGGIKANEGEIYRYPYTIRLIQ